MFDDFYASEVSQVSALGKYIVTYNDGILLSACHDRNLFQIAKIYNGNGEDINLYWKKALSIMTTHYNIWHY